jgi:FkbM family methyltransferase
MRPPTSEGLVDLLRPRRLTSVVDIGANPIDGDPPYKEMLGQRICRVIGFDPQPDVLTRLNASKSDLETYLPYAVGDGGTHTLKICQGSGFASLLQPDEKVLHHFPRFSELGKVVREITLPTRRLDDIAEIGELDLLKIDIQGSELSVFKNGRVRLAKAMVIQTEISFVALYKNQPIFGDVSLELRSLGFIPHMFVTINKKMIAPMVGPNAADGFNQLVEADIVFVRNFTKAEEMDSEQLKHLALIAHHCYGSYDLAMNCIHHLASRNELKPDAKNRYLELVQKRQAAA